VAICGYNEKIGDGLRLLIEGMVDALETKTQVVSVNSVLSRELIELDSIISVLRSARGDVLPEMFIGLNLFASALFAAVRREVCSAAPPTLANACMKVGEQFIELLSMTERENQLLPLSEWSDDAIASRAKLLAGWALQQSKRLETQLTPSQDLPVLEGV
jgi:hypothetical protein